MLRILWNSKSALIAQQEKLDAISNNIANVNTEGYKSEEVGFSDLVYENLKRLGYPVTDNANRINDPINGTGVKANEWIRNNTQGNLSQTNQSTDFALDGEGFFRVILPDGSKAYERSGSFNIDSQGKLVDKNGNRLDVQFYGNPVQLSENNFKVSSDGIISVNNPSGNINVGKINVYNVIGQDSMLSVGNNIYVPKAGAQVYQVNSTNILQGYTELSNVDITKELTDMIMTQRSFEMSTKGLKTADEMWGMVNSLKGR